MNVEPRSVEFSAGASLEALGLRFQQLTIWPVLEEQVIIKHKVGQYPPLEKVLDCFSNILAGGVGVVAVNTRVRLDRGWQLAFGRTGCAEQSTIRDTLNAGTPETVTPLRRALRVILQRPRQSYRHDYAQTWQVLEVDLTGMPAARLGAGVTTGYCAKHKNQRGCQLRGGMSNLV